MAISTPTSVFTENNSSSGTSVGVLTPVAGRLYQIVIMVQASSGVPTDGTLTHAGGETPIKLVTLFANAVTSHRLTLFAFVAAGSTGGTLTYSFAGTGVTFMISEIASGFDATTPIPQFGTNSEINTPDGDMDVTIPGAFVGAGSITLGAVCQGSSGTDWTDPTGWTVLHTRQGASPTNRTRVSYIMGNDSVADWTSTQSGSDQLGIIWEVAADPGGAAGHPTIRRLGREPAGLKGVRIY
jgi:hypothetical protein